ncbi:MAG TPA: MgtC/SapB family protein [Planctomycetota bacterium]|nr:MgtC/SapB family protein [Planctomycetota bacterium]
MNDVEDMCVRIGLAFVCGAILGFERESHGRAAGLRTTILVSCAACVSMILSNHLVSGFESAAWRPDPARLSAGVLTGMGFLGAGSIIRQENVVRGVTTAAVLWFTTMLGLTFGAGYIALGMVAFGVAVLTLFVLPTVEGWVKNDWYATVTITSQIDGPSEIDLRRMLKDMGVRVKNVDLEYNLDERKKVVQYELKFKKTNLIEISRNVVHHLLQQPGITHVKWA